MNDAIPTEGTCPGNLIKFALSLPDLSRPVVRKYFRSSLVVDDKADDSPVTVADREIESLLRAEIARNFPDHGILGEEFGRERMDADYVWVLDPIDGTKSFVTGKPTFGTLIALAYKGKPLLGVIDMPALNETWIGARGHQTLCNGQPVQTRSCESLDQAWMQATSPFMFVTERECDVHDRLTDAVHHPLYGADCYAYGLLANGWVDLVVEASLQLYDYMALVPVVEGAGGVMSNWYGEELDMNSGGQVIACGDPSLLPAVLDCLSGEGEDGDETGEEGV